jgi:hypothetical protein
MFGIGEPKAGLQRFPAGIEPLEEAIEPVYDSMAGG